VALVVALCGAGKAQASTVTIGSSLPSTPLGISFFAENGTTVAPLALSGSGLVRSPVDGRIVRWRVRDASNMPGYAIRVLRSGPEELEFTGAGTSASETPLTNGVGSGIETFETNLPIRAGDYVGLDLPNEGGIGAVEGGSLARLSPRLNDGETRIATTFSYEAAFNADVEASPSVFLLNPSSGPLAGGTAVAVAGADFAGVSSVRFGATPATSFTVESEHRLTALAPPAASTGSVDVTVTTAAGTSATTADDRFTYTSAPPPPVTCTVPNLRGKRLKGAKRSLLRAKCRLGRVKKREGVTAKAGRVVKQKPAAGTQVAADTAVRVTLG